MGQVNKFPLGFLDLIGSQAQGRTPPEQSEVLVPTLDMAEFYAADALASYTLSAAHTAAVTAFSFDHDPSEIWLLRGVSFSTNNLGVGDFEQWRFDIGPTPRTPIGGTANPSIQVWTSDLQTVATAGDGVADSLMLPQPIVIAPGINCVARIIQRDTSAQRTSSIRLALTVLQQ